MTRVSPNRQATIVAGNATLGYGGDGGPATAAALAGPGELAVDATGDIYIPDAIIHDGGVHPSNYRVRKVDSSGIITTFAGTGLRATGGDGGAALNAQLRPYDVTVDTFGNTFFTEFETNSIRRISTTGVVSTYAGIPRQVGPGNSGGGFSGDGGPAIAAQLDNPRSLSSDDTGALYFVDGGSPTVRVRRVTADGLISTVAGGGGSTPASGMVATDADLCIGQSTVAKGVLYVVGCFGGTTDVIWTVSPNGILSKLTDTTQFPKSSCNSVPLIRHGMSVDPNGNVYVIVDGRCVPAEHEQILKVSPGGSVTTVAGNGKAGSGGDGGPAVAAPLSFASQPVVDSGGNVFFLGDNQVRQVDAAGIISTVAGTGLFGFSGDGGPAPEATFYGAAGIALDQGGNLLVSDLNNGRIRRINGVTSTTTSTTAVTSSSTTLAPTTTTPGSTTTVATSGAKPIYVALGDSIASGHGLRPYYGDPENCKRSLDAYPFEVGRLLQTSGVILPFQRADHYACSGSWTVGGDSRKPDVRTQALAAAGRIHNYATSRQGPARPDAYVTVDGGINNFDFASVATAQQMFCDNAQQFRDYVQSMVTNVESDFLGYTGKKLMPPTPQSILGPLLAAGRTTIAITGYYNPIQKNYLHPLLLWWGSQAASCPGNTNVSFSLAANRAAWALDQLNSTLQEVASRANAVVPPNGQGVRLRFVQFEQLFRGNVTCYFDASFVQKLLTLPQDSITRNNGDDCVHPSRSGARLIATLTSAALRTPTDTIGHVSRSRVPFPG